MNPADQNQVTNTTEDIARLKADTERLNTNIQLLVVVLFAGFLVMLVGYGGVIIDQFRSREATYQDLENTINQQTTSIKLLEMKLYGQTF